MDSCVILTAHGPPADADTLGGKGAAVARLMAAGFPVPPAAVLTTRAYREIAASPELADFLEAVQTGAREPSVAEVDAAFLAAPISPSLRAAILSAVRAIAGGRPVAVRSSATTEDLAAASFAGQYRSLLDVSGAEKILRAVRLVWASLSHPAPRAYRRAQGIPDHEASMAVVLMRMVAARRAGVAFTVDPGGVEDALRIESVDGLGEALVSGAVTPDAWVVSRSDPRRRLDGAPLPIAAAAEVALDVEHRLGGPQDVEWAWDGTDLWVVQARPITAGRDVDGFDSATDRAELTTAGIAEAVPGILPPLVWRLASFCLDEGLRRVLDDVGADLADAVDDSGFVRRVRGRAALNLDKLKRAARTLPGESEGEIERQYFGEEATITSSPATTTSSTRRWRALRRDLRVVGARRRAVHEAETVIVAAAEIVAARPDLTGLSDDVLLSYRGRLVDLGARATAAQLGVAAGAAAAYGRLEALLRRHIDDDAARRWVQYLTTDAGAMPVVQEASMAVFAGPTWEEAGVAVPGVDDEGPTPVRRPLDDLQAVLTGSPRWRRTRILTGQLVDVRMHLLRRLATDAVVMLARRERTKAAVLAIGGEVRRVHLELGARLAASGALRGPLDVDLLDDVELRGDRPRPSLAEVNRRRRWLQRYDEEGALPLRFTGRPALAHPSVVIDGATIAGVGASAGRYTGTARFIRGPDARLSAGEVLVAESTDASWSPLFLDAGAIVVARGGPLSHAAIVARELGLPAVLGVSQSVAALDGRRVTVDGDRGLVVLHPDGDRGLPATVPAGEAAVR